MKASRELVYEALSEERDYQEAKWGPSQSTGQHSVGEFLLYMQDYLTEAIRQSSRNGEPLATNLSLDTLRKITAMGVACMEQNGFVRRVK